MAQIESEIVTGCTIKRLKMIYLGTSGKTRKKSEILESKYPIYAWSEGALVRRPQYFDIKFTNYEVDIEDVKEAVRCETDLVSYLIYKV